MSKRIDEIEAWYDGLSSDVETVALAIIRDDIMPLLRVARAAQIYCAAVRPAPWAHEDCTDELVALDAALAALESEARP